MWKKLILLLLVSQSLSIKIRILIILTLIVNCLNLKLMPPHYSRSFQSTYVLDANLTCFAQINWNSQPLALFFPNSLFSTLEVVTLVVTHIHKTFNSYKMTFYTCEWNIIDINEKVLYPAYLMPLSGKDVYSSTYVRLLKAMTTSKVSTRSLF